MLHYLKKYRFHIILFLFVLIPLLALDTSRRNPRQYRFYDHLILRLTYPIQYSLTWALDTLFSTYEHYVQLWNLKQENTHLLQKNRNLYMKLIQLQEIKSENLRLRKLLHFQEKFHLQTLVARIIAKDVSQEFEAIRLNKGSQDGIRKNMAVVTAQGIVGRVFRTTAYTSDVVTILDLLSAVDVINARSRARGIIEGWNEQLCQLKFALRSDDIQAGDLFVSSGLEGVFPKGVPVGHAIEVQKTPEHITQHVLIKPTVEFRKLEEVFVILKHPQTPLHLAILYGKNFF